MKTNIFEKHIEYLSNHYNILSLEEMNKIYES